MRKKLGLEIDIKLIGLARKIVQAQSRKKGLIIYDVSRFRAIDNSLYLAQKRKETILQELKQF